MLTTDVIVYDSILYTISIQLVISWYHNEWQSIMVFYSVSMHCLD